MEQGSSPATTGQRVAIIGAGPVGLEAAIVALRCGYQVQLFERGEIAEQVQRWGHVRLFSPFGLNRSDDALSLLRESGAPLPSDDAFLTGDEYVSQFLKPLAQLPLLAESLRPNTRVLSVGRERLLKGDLIGGDRGAHPFRLLVEQDGIERIEHAEIVLDCSGCWMRPNRIGVGGIPAPGERAAAAQIDYHLPDISAAPERYGGRRLLLVGSGYSAATLLHQITSGKLDERAQPAKLTWAWRGEHAEPFHEIADDPLPQRGELARLANKLAGGANELVDPLPGCSVERITPTDDGALRVEFSGVARPIEVDRILAMVGFSPDRSIYENLQVHECWATLGPIKLAATLLGDGPSDCLAQQAAGFESLTHPEPGFFILGAKSYGKNSSFLIRLGLEQVQEVFSGLDAQSASRSD